MVRKCDGTDPTLTKFIGYTDEDKPVYKPCDCGRRFDDIKYSTAYPHGPIGGGHYGTSFSIYKRFH